ncbi:hypothetical protein [Yinghuangia sp. YIM S10712]|uniref:hypothetical protein n=1 Tax=Yinghuangia sp. YIM S10712 TaxID=3436930 RepID=UPI003F53A2A9
MPRADGRVEAPDPSAVSEHGGAASKFGASEPTKAAQATDVPEAEVSGEPRPEDVREGVVDIVAYTVGALAFVAFGYFTQRDVLTWTRGPFTVVCIVMAVHWIGRRIQVRRGRSGGPG